MLRDKCGMYNYGTFKRSNQIKKKKTTTLPYIPKNSENMEATDQARRMGWVGGGKN